MFLKNLCLYKKLRKMLGEGKVLERMCVAGNGNCLKYAGMYL